MKKSSLLLCFAILNLLGAQSAFADVSGHIINHTVNFLDADPYFTHSFTSHLDRTAPKQRGNYTIVPIKEVWEAKGYVILRGESSRNRPLKCIYIFNYHGSNMDDNVTIEVANHSSLECQVDINGRDLIVG